MAKQTAMTVAIEPSLIFNQPVDASCQQLANRLREYANLKLISIVFVLTEHERERLIDNARQFEFLASLKVLDPVSLSTTAWQDGKWQTEPDLLDPSRVVLGVSSSTSLGIAGSFCSIALSGLNESELLELHNKHRENNSLDQLFVANEDGLKGIFAGLHWFDVLPPGAPENTPSEDFRPGAFSIKRDVARVAVEAWASSVDVVVDRNGWKRTVEMGRAGERKFVVDIEHFQPGDRYAFAIGGKHDKLYPDPRSRSQPEGVHGFSELLGPSNFPWSDRNWQGVSKQDLIIYELHVGTFTENGTFQSAISRLPELVDLGITAIELMPVVESAGRWNWGYDGVNLFAPYHSYGRPDDLRQFVDQCHQHGLAVILDVVYNHPGPEGNYLASFGPYLSKKHHTPWGPAYNFDGRDQDLSRRWVLDNVSYWLSDFHFDGLRFDAIHFMFDDSDPSIVKDISHRVRELGREHGRRYLLIGETNIFDGDMLNPVGEGGADFDAVWCDDLMHSIYSVGSPATRLTDRTYEHHSDITEALNHGFLYEGPPTKRISRKAEAPARTSLIESMVVALQTHDSVGNQPQGKRLHQLTDAGFHCAAAALSLLYPAIPMLFMGDESLDPNPFHYFVDFHDPWLRDAIAKSRRHEHPQQNWEDSISPLSRRAFVESKVSRLVDSDSDGDSASERQLTRAWYRQLISIRKRWIEQSVLSPGNLTVTSWPRFQAFELVYESSNAVRTVVVRLNAPGNADVKPIEIEIEGTVIADSLANPPSAGDSLSKNHAIVVEGRVKLLD